MESGDLVTEMGTVPVPVHLVVTLVTKVELLLTTNLALGVLVEGQALVAVLVVLVGAQLARIFLECDCSYHFEWF
nr:hypothetical protein CFP56_24671 [Quercus suber]